jgi:hypothetical protein
VPDTRQARLDDLAKAVAAFAEKRRDELNQRVATAKKILKGRTGADRLAQTAAQGTQGLVVREINDFLAS